MRAAAGPPRAVRAPPPPPPLPPGPQAGAGRRGGHDRPVPVPPPTPRPPPIDRLTSCPLLLRTFVRHGSHHSAADFVRGGAPLDDEILLHTWLDAPLREITELIKGAHPPARDRNVRLSFLQVYPNARGEPSLREVGSAHAVKRGSDDAKTLAELNFQAGDFLDVAILPSTAASRVP
eukprot:scaffold7419_cov31-Tisochrysis_lutea.AAC.3